MIGLRMKGRWPLLGALSAALVAALTGAFALWPTSFYWPPAQPLRVGYHNRPPLTYTRADGTPDGPTIEAFRRAAAALGISFTWVEVTGELEEALKSAGSMYFPPPPGCLAAWGASTSASRGGNPISPCCGPAAMPTGTVRFEGSPISTHRWTPTLPGSCSRTFRELFGLGGKTLSRRSAWGAPTLSWSKPG